VAARRLAWCSFALGAVAAVACATGVSPARGSHPSEGAVVDIPDSSAAAEEVDSGGAVDEGGTRNEDSETEAALAELQADGGAGFLGLLTVDGGSGFGTGRIVRGRDAGVPRLSDAGVQPSLDPAIIQRVIRQHISAFKACYERALVKDPSSSARVAPRFTIGANGRVASVSLSSSSGDPALDSCIEGVVKRLVFPKPNGGVVVVTYPFVFSPSN